MILMKFDANAQTVLLSEGIQLCSIVLPSSSAIDFSLFKLFQRHLHGIIRAV